MPDTTSIDRPLHGSPTGEISDVHEQMAFVESYANFEDEDGTWFEATCEDSWEMLGNDVEEIFGPNVKLYAEGRSGGWAVIDGLADFEEWDAIDLAKWRRFEKYAHIYANDIPYQVACLWYLNIFEPSYKAGESKRRMLVGVGVGL
jgi:hypothetical protein